MFLSLTGPMEASYVEEQPDCVEVGVKGERHGGKVALRFTTWNHARAFAEAIIAADEAAEREAA